MNVDGRMVRPMVGLLCSREGVIWSVYLAEQSVAPGFLS
jgi:hypothetical protein